MAVYNIDRVWPSHCSKCFTYTEIIYSSELLCKVGTVLSLFHKLKKKKRGTETLSNFPKVKQLGSKGARM